MPATPAAPDVVPRTVVPADIDTADRIAWGLSFRQLAILAGAAGSLWLAYSSFATFLIPLAWVAIAILVLAVAVVAALGRRDGLPLDVWVRHGVTMRTTSRTAVPGTPEPGRPLLATAGKPVAPMPLRSDVTRIDPDGSLIVDGATHSVIACGTTSVALRAGTEQAALLDGFGRWLNAMTGPAEIVVSAARHDLIPYANDLLEAAPRLLHPALRDAAADHAAFLVELDSAREPLQRQVLTVVSGAHARETSIRALASLGITASALDGYAVSAALSTAADPYSPPVPGPRAVPGTPITARSPSC